MKTAVVGASSDRSRFSNKCIRAYHQQGWTVFPVNPKESEILGLRCYPSLADISGKIDVVSLYVNPSIGLSILAEIIRKKPRAVYLNPGTEDQRIIAGLEENGITVLQECSILAIGVNPDEV